MTIMMTTITMFHVCDYTKSRIGIAMID